MKNMKNKNTEIEKNAKCSVRADLFLKNENGTNEK